MEKMQKLRIPYRKMKDMPKAYAHFGMGGGYKPNLLPSKEKSALFSNLYGSYKRYVMPRRLPTGSMTCLFLL